jgi:L-asparaginase
LRFTLYTPLSPVFFASLRLRMRPRVHILYTGGTIGMRAQGGVYRPAPGYLQEQLAGMAELSRPEMPEVSLEELSPLLDSADMRPRDWQRIAEAVAARYDAAEGFVVIHGTDTMAYTASALSFMLGNLGKPVILTGSQIPLAEVRSDARENLIAALLLAAMPIPEVCLYLSGVLLRGNRSTKVSSSGLDAFASPNFPPLGVVGVDIALEWGRLLPPPAAPLRVQALGPAQVAALRLFPGITADILRNFLLEPIQGLVLETYGAGNAPAGDPDLLAVLRRATERGVVIVNCTQCLHGRVEMGDYATGRALREVGVVSGADMTAEAALAKLLYLFSQDLPPDEVARQVQRDLRGELTEAPGGGN